MNTLTEIQFLDQINQVSRIYFLQLCININQFCKSQRAKYEIYIIRII